MFTVDTSNRMLDAEGRSSAMQVVEVGNGNRESFATGIVCLPVANLTPVFSLAREIRDDGFR